MIKRDPLFLKVQQEIEAHNTGTNLGFNESVSYNVLNKIRSSVNNIDFQLSYKIKDNKEVLCWNTKFLFTKPKGDCYEIKTTNKDKLINDIVGAVSDSIRLFLTNTFPQPASTGQTKEEQLYFLVMGRFSEGITEVRYSGQDYNALITILENRLKTQLEEFFQIVRNNQMFTSLDTPEKRKQFVTQLNLQLQNFLNSRKKLILEYTNTIESELESYKEKVSGVFAAANTGMAVSSDEGNLGGGLFVSFKTTKLGKKKQGRLELGFFANGTGELFTDNTTEDFITMDSATNTMDTTTVDSNLEQPFLFGAALKWQISNGVQANFLLTRHFLQEKIGDIKASTELGAGVLINTNVNLIVGVAGFYQMIDEEIVIDEMQTTTINSVWSVGATFQSNQPQSPTLFIGFTSEKSKNDPSLAIQISYPINLVNP